MISRYLRDGKFEIIAHRGGGLEGPENTLFSFENANRVYNDCIFELDVHRTKDNEVVVIHDHTLERTTNGKGLVWDWNWSDLKDLDCAFNFSSDGGRTFPLRGKGIGIPRLADIFEKFPRSRVSIEIKHGNPYFSDKILEVIRAYKAEERIVLAGAEHGVLSEARSRAPNLCSGYSSREVKKTLIWQKLHLPLFLPRRGQVFQVPQRAQETVVVTPTFVQNAHRYGKHVHVWTVNDEATMRQLIEMGVDGIITDAPSLLVKVAREHKKI